MAFVSWQLFIYFFDKDPGSLKKHKSEHLSHTFAFDHIHIFWVPKISKIPDIVLQHPR